MRFMLHWSLSISALEKQKQSLEQLAEEKLKWKLQKQEHGYRNDFEKQVHTRCIPLCGDHRVLHAEQLLQYIHPSLDQ